MKQEKFDKICKDIYKRKFLGYLTYIDNKYFSEGRGKEVEDLANELDEILSKHTLNETVLVLSNALVVAWEQMMKEELNDIQTR